MREKRICLQNVYLIPPQFLTYAIRCPFICALVAVGVVMVVLMLMALGVVVVVVADCKLTLSGGHNCGEREAGFCKENSDRDS